MYVQYNDCGVGPRKAWISGELIEDNRIEVFVIQ